MQLNDKDADNIIDIISMRLIVCTLESVLDVLKCLEDLKHNINLNLDNFVSNLHDYRVSHILERNLIVLDIKKKSIYLTSSIYDSFTFKFASKYVFYDICGNNTFTSTVQFLPVFKDGVKSLNIFDKNNTNINLRSCTIPITAHDREKMDLNLCNLDILLHNINTIHIIDSGWFTASDTLTDVLTNVRNHKVFREIIDLTKTYKLSKYE
jgi:hypothetical protein